MDKRLRQLLALLPVLFVTWGALGYLAKHSRLALMIVWGLALANLAICWMACYQRQLLIALHVIPGIKQYVNFIGRWVGEQHTNEFDKAELLIVNDDLSQTKETVKSMVRGHDRIVDRIFDHLQTAFALKRGRVQSRAYQRPLCAVLIVGGDGMGKRFLARVMASTLYRNGTLLNLEADKLGPDPCSVMFGSKGSPGALTESVRRQPHQIILIERAENLGPDASRLMVDLLQYGVTVAGDSGRKISFQHCIFLFTTALCHEAMIGLASKGLPIDSWRRQAAELLSSETGIDSAFATSLSDILVCEPMSDLTKAEVIAGIMRDECTTFNVNLTAVDPEILVGEVTHIDPVVGFARVPARVRHMLREPLRKATERGHGDMSLRAIPRA